MNQYLNRKYLIIGIFIIISVIYIIRLFALQVVDESYKLSANNNVLRYITRYPARGLIYDRNGKLLVFNQAAYDIMIVPNQMKAFDTVQLCSLLNISQDQVLEKIRKAKRYSRYKPSIFLEQVSKETYATFQELQHRYSGFFVQTRTLREYPFKNAAHVLGYIGEVSEKITKDDQYYKSGDYIGINGVEKSYEEVLRGEKGVEILMVDVHNREKGKYKEGKYDTQAKHGGNITLSLDIELQAYAEQLMQGKIGSVVAIEPSTGEILCLVSAPGYSPDLMVGRVRSENYQKMQEDTLIPLFNRAIMARVPPGSTFKPVNALIGLQEGIVRTTTTYSCFMGYHIGRFSMGCHSHANNLDLIESIQQSCNSYYAHLYRDMLDNPKYGKLSSAFDRWRTLTSSFGFGKPLGVDFPNEVGGYVPTLSFYERIHGKGAVKSLNLVSLSIGQGELLMTPLQLANEAALIANRGYYYSPHVIKNLPGEFIEKTMPFKVKRYADIDTALFSPVVEGMWRAANTPGGTAYWYGKPGLDICGKTGTAENPHGEDHSLFIAFAPKDNPKIAVAVYVQNGGFGATWAAPIASLTIEKYLQDTVSRTWIEERMIQGDLIKNPPVKKQKKTTVKNNRSTVQKTETTETTTED